MNLTLKSRLMAMLVGLVLTVLLAGWFLPVMLPESMQQFDFWLAWLACMLLLALPLSLLEVALSKRHQEAPLQALSAMTREADVQPIWRGVGWLAVTVMAMLGGGLLLHAAQSMQQIEVLHPVANFLPVLLAVAGLLVSLLPRLILLMVAVVAVVVGSVLNLAQVDYTVWQWTAFGMREWGGAVVLALTATGLGYGVYWQLTTAQPQPQASRLALPVLVAQLAGGVLFALSQTAPSQVSLWLFGLALLSAGAFLLSLLREQLQARGVAMPLQWMFAAAGVLVWLLPFTSLLTWLTIMLALVASVLYAVFSGWLMKISHMRKALNFQSEITYNLWRIAVRIVIPLAILMAVIGLLLPH